MKQKILLALAATAFIQCQSPQKVSEPETNLYMDTHSYARPHEVQLTHLDLELKVDFLSQTLEGIATWQFDNKGNHKQILLDSYQLRIEKITDGKDQELNWELGKHDEILGSALSISLNENTESIKIHYKTPPDAGALQWLAPIQTHDKKHPFLFTQSQAILARTWIPCQDSPGVRYTYHAKVQVPEGFLALMSASNPQEYSPTNIYHFEMKQPVPSYLMALAAGKFEFQAISERAGVYAEPGQLAAAVAEFEDVEKMIQSAEALYGPYAWEQYDILVLPPSFPFGGMENPRLTFATPTIIAGDKSLVSLVAHELAHSWSGNLVTNATWNDFWLNEGFTVYFEHRIMEAIYGHDYAEMLASLSYKDLLETLEELMESKPEDTRLKIDLSGRNPDDGVTAIAYDKGYFLLRTIEEHVGRERFDAFLKKYFDHFQFKVIITEDFIDFLKTHLLSEEEYTHLQVDRWIYDTGLPENCVQPRSSLFAAVAEAATSFLKAQKLPEKSITDAWSTHEWLHFLHQTCPKLNAEQMKSLDFMYQFTQSTNAEIQAAWYLYALHTAYEGASDEMLAFMSTVGRRKFIVPLYKAMIELGQKEKARSIYAEAKGNYHSVAIKTLDELLK